MKVYVTSVGTSPEAVFNPLWFLVEVYSWVPDKIYLFWNDEVTDVLNKVTELIERLKKAYNVDIEIIADESMKFSEENPIEFRDKVSSLLQSLRREEVIVDITPGRKFMSALMLGAGMINNVEEIVYLHLQDFRRYMGRLLFEIPMVEQQLFFKEHLTGKRGNVKFPGRKKDEPQEVKIRREDLMAVINSMYIDGEDVFTVKVGNALVGRVRLDKKVEFTVPSFIDLNDDVHGNYNLVKEALIAGGLAKFRNWDELISLIRTLRASKRPIYIGFDTNALYFMVPSKILEDPRFRERGNLIVDFVYSDEVAEEVGKKLNQKLPYGREYGEFSNQPTPKARLAMLGSIELEKIKMLGAERTKSKEIAEGDTKIALDYKVFAEEKDANVIVVTTDDTAYSEMEAYSGTGLIPFKLEWEFSFGSTLEGTWEELRDSIYTLAVLLGELKVGKYSILGIWRGKNHRDWRDETVKVRNFEYSRILTMLK
ncbi:hypothetical protein A3L04_01070 [Thermococcus chitonophagus]|uniref:CRISPR-associated protein n=1 Tax=Thermococcus chitonophagus TaxID=54262 RepID=A0A170SAZ3_9EURY|nr:hypothetical protein [Thermococcus chitonophagus]ASJ15760.1 hypothetical protein A3L04_01070 [Thermococcus chitonophagus]CUX76984.1 hypothetical protein CHITON_0205 [Thermococcus chitonophagus]